MGLVLDPFRLLSRPGCGNGWLRWQEVKPMVMMLSENVWVI
ncbi:MAG TPA: hypothetical protein VG206_08650 [Terriglobia bacterium]|nr:hypothetical protein [Terriglobia bacterium]